MLGSIHRLSVSGERVSIWIVRVSHTGRLARRDPYGQRLERETIKRRVGSPIHGARRLLLVFSTTERVSACYQQRKSGSYTGTTIAGASTIANGRRQSCSARYSTDARRGIFQGNGFGVSCAFCGRFHQPSLRTQSK